jgi:hypothetical protein
LFLSNPIKGVDIGDKKDALRDKYKEKTFQFGLETNSMEIIGFGFFLMGWIIYPLIYAKQYKDWLSMLIILTFAVAWTTEIYFDRSLGGMLTGFFIPFLLVNRKKGNSSIDYLLCRVQLLFLYRRKMFLPNCHTSGNYILTRLNLTVRLTS